MNPLKELINTLTVKSSNSGTVVNKLSDTSYLVSVRTGVISCTLGISTTLKIGDKVSLSGTTIIAKLANEDDIPHFIV